MLSNREFGMPACLCGMPCVIKFKLNVCKTVCYYMLSFFSRQTSSSTSPPSFSPYLMISSRCYIKHLKEFKSLSTWKFEILMKHCSSCLIHYMKSAVSQTTTSTLIWCFSISTLCLTVYIYRYAFYIRVDGCKVKRNVYKTVFYYILSLFSYGHPLQPLPLSPTPTSTPPPPPPTLPFVVPTCAVTMLMQN